MSHCQTNLLHSDWTLHAMTTTSCCHHYPSIQLSACRSDACLTLVHTWTKHHVQLFVQLMRLGHLHQRCGQMDDSPRGQMEGGLAGQLHSKLGWRLTHLDTLVVTWLTSDSDYNIILWKAIATDIQSVSSGNYNLLPHKISTWEIYIYIYIYIYIHVCINASMHQYMSV